MQDQNQEILFIIAVGIVIALLLVGFIITILFFYQRRQNQQEKEIAALTEQYQKELLSSQLEMQDNTMKQIGVELHDNIKQQLVVVTTSLRYLPIDIDSDAYSTVKEIREEINGIINDIGLLSHSLHSDRVAQVGLLDSINQELFKFSRIKTIELKYSCLVRYNYYDGQTSTFIFRMFQEFLQNILKHAKATIVSVNIFDNDKNQFVIQVSDNGVGFDTSNKDKVVSGIGLSNIYNRAKLIGATIIVESQLGNGTTVSLLLPIPSE